MWGSVIPLVGRVIAVSVCGLVGQAGPGSQIGWPPLTCRVCLWGSEPAVSSCLSLQGAGLARFTDAQRRPQASRWRQDHQSEERQGPGEVSAPGQRVPRAKLRTPSLPSRPLWVLHCLRPLQAERNLYLSCLFPWLPHSSQQSPCTLGTGSSRISQGSFWGLKVPIWEMGGSLLLLPWWFQRFASTSNLVTQV